MNVLSERSQLIQNNIIHSNRIPFDKFERLHFVYRKLLTLKKMKQKNNEMINNMSNEADRENGNSLNGVSRPRQLYALDIFISNLDEEYESNLKELKKIRSDLQKKRFIILNESLNEEQLRLIKD